MLPVLLLGTCLEVGTELFSYELNANCGPRSLGAIGVAFVVDGVATYSPPCARKVPGEVKFQLA